MLTKLKILPIHSQTHSRGKLITLSQRSKRVQRNISSQQLIQPQPKMIQEPRLYKPRSSVLRRTHKSQVSTPAEFITDPPMLNEKYLRPGTSQSGSRKTSIRRSTYLPKKILAKEMMEHYLNNVFKKVSVTRTGEKKSTTDSKRNRTKSTLAFL